jgi:hypothetical protein
MKKFFLGVFILIDLGLIGGSGYVLFRYVKDKLPAHTILSLSQTIGSSTAPAAAATGTGGLLPTPAASTDSSVRKILFSYRNPHAKQVSIRADFTGWKAEAMQKGAKGVWTYQVPLTPGEYAYCFTVDDKTFKDPANKRTKVIGRTTVSAIMVEARPAKAAK